jgi:hypothetical protein
VTGPDRSQPPVPAHLAGRPTVGGLVVPVITPRTIDGRYLFGKLGDLTQQRCLRQYRCGVCATLLSDKAVVFARATDLLWQCTSEPAVCPPCAAYSAEACPMLAGRMARYRASQHPALAGIPIPADEDLRLGAPAERWYAVWIRGYNVVDHPAKPGTLAASWATIPPLRIRPIPITG